MDFSYRPALVARSGVQLVTLMVAIPTLTASATTTIRMPTPFRRAYILDAAVHAATPPGSAGGTLQTTVKKRDISAGSDVSVSAAFNIEGLVAHKVAAFTLNTGDAARLKAADDSLFVTVVSDAAIETQPASGFLVVTLALLD